jgi:hypothetical protein
MRVFRARRPLLLAVTLSLAAATLAATATSPAQAAYSGEPLLAWVHWEGGSTAQLWAGAPDRTEQHYVYSTASYNVALPAVSQDGAQIAFVAWRDDPRYMQRIYAINASGSGLRRWTLPTAPYSDETPVWAPDRSAIYFVRYNTSSGTSRIFRITSPGATPTVVPNTGGGFFPTVSPDGRYLAFERNASIVVVKTNGDDPFVLKAAPSRRHGYYAPAWSPDGTRLSVLDDVRNETTTIAMLDTSGTELAAVTSYRWEIGLSAVAWADDSAMLFYSVHVPDPGGDIVNLRRVAAQAGASPTRLTFNRSPSIWDFVPSLGGGAGPAADATAPVLVPGTTAVDSSAVRLRYSLGGDRADAARFVIRYSEGATPPATMDEGLPGYDGLRRSVAVGGLTPQTEYSFSVFAVDWAGNVSAPISETLTTARASSFASSVSRTALRYGQQVRVHGHLTDTADGTPLAGRSVALYARRSTTSTWTRVATATTDVDGKVSALHQPASHTYYSWRHASDGTQGSASSPQRLVKVATAVTAGFSDATIRLGETTYLRGSVMPGHPKQYVYLQRYYGGEWHHVTKKLLTSTSRYSFAIKPTSRGTRTYRVVKKADTDHSTGISPTRTLTIR